MDSQSLAPLDNRCSIQETGEIAPGKNGARRKENCTCSSDSAFAHFPEPCARPAPPLIRNPLPTRWPQSIIPTSSSCPLTESSGDQGTSAGTSACSRPCAMPAICLGDGATTTPFTVRVRVSTGSPHGSIASGQKKTKPGTEPARTRDLQGERMSDYDTRRPIGLSQFAGIARADGSPKKMQLDFGIGS